MPYRDITVGDVINSLEEAVIEYFNIKKGSYYRKDTKEYDKMIKIVLNKYELLDICLCIDYLAWEISEIGKKADKAISEFDKKLAERELKTKEFYFRPSTVFRPKQFPDIYSRAISWKKENELKQVKKSIPKIVEELKPEGKVTQEELDNMIKGLRSINRDPEKDARYIEAKAKFGRGE